MEITGSGGPLVMVVRRGRTAPPEPRRRPRRRRGQTLAEQFGCKTCRCGSKRFYVGTPKYKALIAWQRGATVAAILKRFHRVPEAKVRSWVRDFERAGVRRNTRRGGAT